MSTTEGSNLFERLSTRTLESNLTSSKSPRSPRPGGAQKNLSPRRRTPEASSPRRHRNPDASSPSTWNSLGCGGHPFKGKLPSPETLSRWAITIALAREAGQFSCSLGTLEPGEHYDWVGNGFHFSINSPFENAIMDTWRATHHVNFVIRVPIHKEMLAVGERPQYPLHYASFGYLTAAWFIPHPDDLEGLERGSKVNSEAHVREMLPSFDKKRHMAQEAGQYECLLLVLGGSDFSSEIKEQGDKTYIRHKLDGHFAPAIEWAVMRGIRLVIRVPDNHYTQGIFFDETLPCLFGYLLANWEIPLATGGD